MNTLHLTEKELRTILTEAIYHYHKMTDRIVDHDSARATAWIYTAQRVMKEERENHPTLFF